MSAYLKWRNLAIGAILLSIQCGGVRIQPHPDQQAEGLRFYRSRPYVVVSRQEAGQGNQLAWRLVYLPDREQEYVVQPRRSLFGKMPNIRFTESGLLSAVGGDSAEGASATPPVEGILEGRQDLKPGLYEVNWIQGNRGNMAPRLELGRRVGLGGSVGLQVESVDFLSSADRPELPQTALIRLSRRLRQGEAVRADLYGSKKVCSGTFVAAEDRSPAHFDSLPLDSNLITLPLKKMGCEVLVPQVTRLLVFVQDNDQIPWEARTSAHDISGYARNKRQGAGWLLIAEGEFPAQGSLSDLSPTAHMRALPARLADRLLVAIDYDRRQGSPLHLEQCTITVHEGTTRLMRSQYEVVATSPSSQLVSIPVQPGQDILITARPKNQAGHFGNSRSLQVSIPPPPVEAEAPQVLVAPFPTSGGCFCCPGGQACPPALHEISLDLSGLARKQPENRRPEEGMRPLTFSIHPSRSAASPTNALLRLMLDKPSGAQTDSPRFQLSRCQRPPLPAAGRPPSPNSTANQGGKKCQPADTYSSEPETGFDAQGRYVIEARVPPDKAVKSDSTYCACFGFQAISGFKPMRDQPCEDYRFEVCRLVTHDLLFPGSRDRSPAASSR